LIALVLYLISYNFIEHRRTRKGPWLVTFNTESNGVPVLTINQPFLQISNVRLTFPGNAPNATNVTMDFRVPKQVPFEVPFGQCLFEDTTFLPGTIVFKLFGHEIQLIPRVLTVDQVEYPWRSESVMAVTNALSNSK